MINIKAFISLPFSCNGIIVCFNQKFPAKQGEKMKEQQKAYFGKKMGCTVPVCWLKYTTALLNNVSKALRLPNLKSR